MFGLTKQTIDNPGLYVASAEVSLDNFWPAHTVTGCSHQQCLKQVRERSLE